MIVGARKAESGAGVTPDWKKTRSGEENDGMTQSDKIDKMFDMMTNMQKDMGQTKLLFGPPFKPQTWQCRR